jgi:hypothetical protein
MATTAPDIRVHFATRRLLEVLRAPGAGPGSTVYAILEFSLL